ncbi:hypothetical protein NDI56_02255 [Haloarcula sp. S1CR25-12]|uniref:Uncharacterized protein n=1 Tax=Haloarcula saliterrae TaxID=2950534 RepID=A0ABU2F8I7_9EURY|nr:hypothetical protein [Haloarcula sp. S1CR25-12]MDS0258228.1 hypothetical protein [Haloarcula sp. S1CR25-12]
MADTSPRFGGLVVASLAGVVGTKYLLGGALAGAGVSVVQSVLVTDSLAVTFAVGILLGIVTGALAGGFILARVMTIVSFLTVMALSVPALRIGDPVIVAESVGMGLALLYLFVRSPIERVEAAHIDDTDSASRTGSTLR